MTTAPATHFKHDVFVSYARLDDDFMLPGEERSRWLRTLKSILGTLLGQRLARGPNIWMDISGIRGNEVFPEKIRSAASSSATLLVIMSPAYLASDWCRLELEAFLAAAGSEAEGRVFIVRREGIAYNKWPEALRDLGVSGYPFFQQDAESNDMRPLGIPMPTRKDRDYYDRLLKLRNDLAIQIERLSRDDDSSPSCNDHQGPTVLLAEVTMDLYDQRQQLADYLKDKGCRVLPQAAYPRTPSKFQAALDCDLEAANLFVQLLGRYGSPRTEDLPSGYDGLQLERARAMGKAMLQWRSPALDLAKVTDEVQRNILAGEEVVAADLTEFMRIVEDEARRWLARASHPPINGELFILVSAHHQDQAAADAIGKRLAAYKIIYDIVTEDVSWVHLAREDDCDGVVVVYGQSKEIWVRRQLGRCRCVMLERKQHTPACAVFLTPPAEKGKLNSPQRFYLIQHEDPQGLEEYVAAVRARRRAS